MIDLLSTWTASLNQLCQWCPPKDIVSVLDDSELWQVDSIEALIETSPKKPETQPPYDGIELLFEEGTLPDLLEPFFWGFKPNLSFLIKIQHVGNRFGAVPGARDNRRPHKGIYLECMLCPAKENCKQQGNRFCEKRKYISRKLVFPRSFKMQCRPW